MLRYICMLNRIRCLGWGAALLLALALVPVCALGQAPGYWSRQTRRLRQGWVSSASRPAQLPDAPEPQVNPTSRDHGGAIPAADRKLIADLAKAAPLAANTDSTQSGGQDATDPAIHEGAEAPLVAMAPHPEDSLWWISGQANIIIQGDLPFHSPYEGTNSFRNSAEYKTSLVGTLYGAIRRSHSIRWNTDFILDLESTGGRGLSQALGLAGFTNLDVVRNPNLGPVPYLARYGIHQVLGLTQQTASQEAGPFGLAPTVPLRRIEFRVGKMTLPDFFDINGPGSDSHLQFMNWTVDNNGAWDYAADTRGYTVGGMVEYDDVSWSIRYGLFAMPVVANGIDMDWAFSRAHGGNAEFELRRSLVKNRKGIARVLYFDNRAHMGTYREAVDDFLNGTDEAKYGLTVPDITKHEHFSALKYGVGVNAEQEVTENLRVFGRFGWNEGQHESYAYTEVDQTFLGRRRLCWSTLEAAGRQDRVDGGVECNQARPSKLSEARRARVPAGRRQSELRTRDHRGGLLQLPCVAGSVLCAGRAAHR